MRMREEPVAETPLLGSHFEPEEPEHEEEEATPSKGSVPPPPNTFSEAEALRWPAIREALADETRQSVGQGLAVRVVRVSPVVVRMGLTRAMVVRVGLAMLVVRVAVSIMTVLS